MRGLALKQFEGIVVIIITIATRLDTVNTMSGSLSVLVSQVDDRISIGTGQAEDNAWSSLRCILRVSGTINIDAVF